MLEAAVCTVAAALCLLSCSQGGEGKVRSVY